jgi:para-nitrobenzyl esterase
LGVYAGADGTDPADGDVATAFYTDYRMRCGPSLIAHWHALRAPTWRFEYSHGYEPLGAVHIWDMMYLFGWLQPPADQPRDARLSDELQSYWIDFASSGNPNAAGLPAWPMSGAGGGYLDFTSEGPAAKSGPRRAACDLFARKIERDLSTMRTNPATH